MLAATLASFSKEVDFGEAKRRRIAKKYKNFLPILRRYAPAPFKRSPNIKQAHHNK